MSQVLLNSTISRNESNGKTQPASQLSFIAERHKVIERLQVLGLPPLPVAPAFPVETHWIESKDGARKPKFNGKNPSYLDKNGNPHLIAHSRYQNESPTPAIIKKWFEHPFTGVGTFGGCNGIYWLDVDRKHFESQENCNQWTIERFKVGWLEQTQSGGYRIPLHLKQIPDFTNFADKPGGKHLGELKGKGNFVVLAPTVGSGGNYQIIRSGDPVDIESLESFGIYPVHSEKPLPVSSSAPAQHRDVSLLDCCKSEVRDFFKTEVSEDKSKDITAAARELYGWENWLIKHQVDFVGNAESLISTLASNWGINESRLARILKRVNRAECVPSCVYVGGDESAQKRINKLLGKKSEQELEQQSPVLCKMLQLKQSIENASNGELRLNQLTQQLEYQGKPIKAGRYKLFLAQLLNVDVSRDDAVEVLGAIGEENAYHPVKNHLNSVYEKYGDSTVHLLDKPSDLLLKTRIPIYNSYLRNLMIGAVARIYRPGCKLDEMCVLHGKQGFRKSTFWKALASEEFFSDSLGRDVDSKDELMKLYTTWFMEIDELDRVTNYKEASTIKSFATRANDQFRAPYERSIEPHLRMCAVVATVNKTEFLVDETGNRRFQVITINEKIDIDKVIELRDQLWAAAVARFKRGDVWYLTPEEEEVAAEQVKQYENTDLWYNPVAEYLSNSINLVYLDDDKEYILPEKILENALKIDAGRIDHGHKKRLSSILRSLGWEPANGGQPIRLPGDKPRRAWVKTASGVNSDSSLESDQVDAPPQNNDVEPCENSDLSADDHPKHSQANLIASSGEFKLNDKVVDKVSNHQGLIDEIDNSGQCLVIGALIHAWRSPNDLALVINEF